MNARNRNELWARALLDELARGGVRHLVVAPGSRSTPLVLAAASDPRFRCAVQVDERSAAFLALGVGKVTGIPAAVITTSGTAVANLLPAVVEASQSETPLLLLTADRPPRLRGADANQAIEQPGIFGGYLRLFQEASPAEISDRTLRHLRGVASRAVAAAVGDPAGPVHLNLPFEKPLEPVPVPGDLPADLAEAAPLAEAGRSGGAPFTRISPARLAPDPGALEALVQALGRAERPLLVAGPHPRPREVGPILVELASALGAPLLADPLSGARVATPRPDAPPGWGYDLALRDPATARALRPDLVLRFGTTPSSASLGAWLDQLRDVPQVVVDGGGRWKDHLSVAHEVLRGDATLLARGILESLSRGAAPGAVDASWGEGWRAADQAVREGVTRALQGAFPEGAAAVAAAVAAAMPAARAGQGVGAGGPPHGPSHAPLHAPGPILFVSNSMPVRDLDALVPAGVDPDDGAGTLLHALGNRGASGIDGIVSTALGVGWGTGAPVVALVGDLALVHDMNGFLAASELSRNGGGAPRVTFLVVNNDGGGIFHLLPVRDHDPAFTRFVATPHGIEPRAVAALHGIPFRQVVQAGGGASDTAAAAADARAVETGSDGATASPADAPSLADALRWADAQSGVALVEIRSHRHENRLQHGALVDAVRAALARSGPADRLPHVPLPLLGGEAAP